MCKLFDVTRSGFYQYQKKSKEPDPVHEELLEWTRKIAESSNYTYGCRRMKAALNTLGYPLGMDKTKKLMNFHLNFCQIAWCLNRITTRR